MSEPTAVVTPEPQERVVPSFRPDDVERDENGMTIEDIYDQLEDESHVVTSGRGSILPRAESTGGSTTTGYSVGSGSGSGSDD